MMTNPSKPYHHIPERDRDRVNPGPQKKLVDDLIRKLTAPLPEPKKGVKK